MVTKHNLTPKSTNLSNDAKNTSPATNRLQFPHFEMT